MKRTKKVKTKKLDLSKETFAILSKEQIKKIYGGGGFIPGGPGGGGPIGPTG